MEVDLTVVAPADWALWRELRLRALGEAPYAFASTLAEWSGDGDTEGRWRNRLTSVPLNLAASIDGTAVGMASATSPVDGEVEIISMWVAPEARRRHVAATLVETILAWALQQGAVRAALDVREGNGPAISLYEGCGFVDAGRSPNSQPGIPERRMVRWLRPSTEAAAAV